MPKILKTTCAMTALFCAAGVLGQASAEPVNYGALEALFEEPVTLSATGAPQRVTEAPVNMTIISQADIRRSGAVDLPGVLERLASVDVMRSTGGQADVSIRGYNTTLSPRLLVLLNGRQVYLDIYGMTNWDLIPVQLAEIRQIEVVTGPNTALFGFNAVAGVVNIITYDPINDDVDEVSVRAGSSSHIAGAGIWTLHASERLGARLSFGGFDAQALYNDDVAAQAFLASDAIDPNARTVNLDLAYDLNPRTRVNLEASWGRNERLTRYGPGLITFPFETNSLKFSLASETGLGLVNAVVYSNGLEVGIENRISLASLELVSKPAPAHITRVAGELRRNEVDQGTGELGYDVAALSGMWSWQASSALALTTAVRYDHLSLSREGSLPAFFPFSNSDYDREFGEWSYNLGAVLRFENGDSLRLSGARGVGLPSLLDYGSEVVVPVPIMPGMLLIVAGDPATLPVIVHNVEAGYDRPLADIGARLRFSVFWQKNEDLRAFASREQILSLAPFVRALLPAQIGDSEMHGFEASLEGERGSWRWDLRYSYREIDDALTYPVAASQMDFQSSSPDHVLTAGLGWSGARFEWNADLRYLSDTTQYGRGADLRGAYDVEAHVLVNARALWRASESASIELSGRNLLDDRTQGPGLAPLERSFYVTARKLF